MKQTTQEQYPWRATVRTFIQSLIPTLGILVFVLPPAIDILLEEFGARGIELSPSVYGFLAGTSLFIAAIAAAITRVSAIPQVEELLKRFIPVVSAEPREDNKTYQDNETVEVSEL